MAANFKVGITIGSAVGGALTGLGRVSSSLKTLRDDSIKAENRIGAIGKNNQRLMGELTKTTVKAGAALAALTMPAIQFESAVTSIKKVVDFESPEGFKNLTDDILKLSPALGMLPAQLAEIAAFGGQGGIGEHDLLGFASNTAKMAVAFEITPVDAGDLAAKAANVYKIAVSDLPALGDSINELSSSSPAKPQEIMQGMMGFGSGAQSWGIAADEAAALTSIGISMGKDAAVVSTAFRNLFMKLNDMEGQNKDFKKALGDIGITTKAFRAGQKKDPAQALVDFLGQLSNLGNEDRTGVINSLLGGNQGAELIAAMAGNMELVQKQFGVVRTLDAEGHKKYLGSMEKEYESVAATTAHNLKKLRSSVTVLAITIGDSILPAFNGFIDRLDPIIKGATEWAQANPELITQGFKIAGMLVAARLALLSFDLMIGGSIVSILKLWGGLKIGWSILAGTVKFGWKLGSVLIGPVFKGLMLAGKAVLFLGRALLMNPIGLAITGIAIAAFLIYKYWEPIKGFFSDLWANIKSFFSSGIGNITKTILDWSPIGLFHKVFAAVLSWFGVDIPSSFTEFGGLIINGLIGGVSAIWEGGKALFTNIVDFIKNPFGLLPESFTSFGGGIISALMGGVGTAWEGAKGIFTGIIDFIKNPFSALSPEFDGYGKNVLDGLVGGIESKLEAAKASITKVGNSIKGWFTSVLGINSPSRVFIGYGDNITTGAAIGIENALPKAKKSIDKLSDEMQLKGGNIAANFSGSGAINGGANKGNITIHFNPTINAMDATGVGEKLKYNVVELEKMIAEIIRRRDRRAY